MKKYKKEIKIENNTITLESGKLAPQANASVTATMGKTVVLATVVMGSVDQERDYFPLSVQLVNRLYAGGVVKGSRWIKRDMYASDNDTLSARIIDRSIRPLFPKGFRNDLQVVVTVLSNDKETDFLIPAFMAVSTALLISDIPFNGPVSAVRIFKDKDKLLSCPSVTQLDQSDLDLIVCTGPAGVNMIEAGAKIVDDKTMLGAIRLAKNLGENINAKLTEFTTPIANKKIKFTPVLPSEDLIKQVDSLIKKDIDNFFKNGGDINSFSAKQKIIDKAKEAYLDKIKSWEVNENLFVHAVEHLIEKQLRTNALSNNRFDSRKADEIRPLEIDTSVLPCTHGSAMFKRGLTQVVTVSTLSPLSERLHLEDSGGEGTKRYMHYYSAMPFSTGQTGRIGRPGRREIGHGALAEKALSPVIPSEQDFPYTIILTSEIMSQNGSSSMASTCGSTMSLMDAGVPIKEKVAGISIGMVSDGDKKFTLLTDIAGIEDHFGDMDFKITGTKTGITAIQLDIKRQGLTMEMIEKTFEASTKARLEILKQMEIVLSEPRKELSVYAPKVAMLKLPEDKIGDVIGSAGKTIKGLMKKYGVQIDIDDDGIASVSSDSFDKTNKCIKEIEAMIKEVEIGEEYDGVVTRIEDYGAFVEFLPGREALLHVSELSQGFVSNPNTLVKIGDKIHVKVTGFNDNHQIKLSAPEFKAAHPGSNQGLNQPHGRFSGRTTPPQRPQRFPSQGQSQQSKFFPPTNNKSNFRKPAPRSDTNRIQYKNNKY
ncbi:polyribonucleotide nucleotidyltransferase [Patescibacteria group bacterium]|nr:polyribonucleotide nucleotidyltransferase [Patescibacteria group bacterium]